MNKLPELGAYGISVAHSGLIFALLFAAEDTFKMEHAKNCVL